MQQLPTGGSTSGCVLRAFWLFAGPALLFVLAVPLARHAREGIGIHVLYFATLVAAAIARLLDRSPTSAEPDSATALPPPGKRPYLIGILAGGVALWAAAWWLGPEILR